MLRCGVIRATRDAPLKVAKTRATERGSRVSRTRRVGGRRRAGRSRARWCRARSCRVVRVVPVGVVPVGVVPVRRPVTVEPVAVRPVPVDSRIGVGAGSTVRAGAAFPGGELLLQLGQQVALGAVEQRRFHVRCRRRGGLRLVRVRAATATRAREVRCRSVGHASGRRRRLAEERDVVRTRRRKVQRHGTSWVTRGRGRDRAPGRSGRPRRGADPCGGRVEQRPVGRRPRAARPMRSRLGDRAVPTTCRRLRERAARVRAEEIGLRTCLGPAARTRWIRRRAARVGPGAAAGSRGAREPRAAVAGCVRSARPHSRRRRARWPSRRRRTPRRAPRGRRGDAAGRPGASPIHRTASRPPTPAARRPSRPTRTRPARMRSHPPHPPHPPPRRP